MAIFDRMTALTAKQETFCVELVNSRDGNATAAYRKAYDTRNMAIQTVCRNASKLRSLPRIAARIAELRARASEKQGLSIEEVLEEVKRIAFVDPLAIYGADGRVLPMEDIPEGTRRAVASLVIKANGDTIVKFCEKTQALDRLMRFLGLFEKDNKQRFGFLDDLPRGMLKEFEECMLEIARTRAEEAAAGGNGGGLTH